MRFYDKILLKKDEDGNTVKPKGGDYLVPINSRALDGGSLPIAEFSPQQQTEQLENNLNVNMKLLEVFCGISPGLITDVITDLATATAIRSSLYDTMAFVRLMRKRLEVAITTIAYSVEMIYNKTSTSGTMPKYSISFDWDDTMLENSVEMFNMLLQSYGIGEIQKGEIRSWLKNIPLAQAKQDLEESNLLTQIQ